MTIITRLLSYLRQRDRAWVLSLLLAVGIVYLPFLGNPFVFDDLPFFSGGGAAHYATLMFHFDLRWLPYASLGWTYAVFSDIDPHMYHLGNTLLHAANVILLFYLMRQLARTATDNSDASEPSGVVWGAWLGALIFACHPVAVYAAGYVIERSILMATLFGLLMYWAYVRAILSGNGRWLLLSVASYFMACFSKEHSAMLPLALMPLAFLLQDKSRIDRKLLWQTWGAFGAIFVLIVLRAKGVFGVPYEIMALQMFEQQHIEVSTTMLHLLSVLTQAGLFFKYLLLWLLPNPAWMSVDMREQFIPVWTSWQGWLGLLAFAGYGIFAIRLLLRRGRAGLIGFALLYPWILFLIEFSSIRIQEPFVLYRSYLWMTCVMLLVPVVLMSMPRRRNVLVLGMIVLALVPLAWNRLWTLGDNYRLWNDAVRLLPSEHVAGADRVYYNRAESLALRGDWKGAATDFERAVKLSPELPQIRKELGISYANLGRYQEAVVQFDEAIVLEPKFMVAYYYKGLALKKLHQDELAMQQMKKSCELGYAVACVIVSYHPPKQ